MRASLTQVSAVRLAGAVVRETHAHLAETGRAGLEGLALWAGRQIEETFAISHVLIPRQTGIRNEHGLAVVVPTDELRRLSLHLHAEGVRLFAQVHSHPGAAYHSRMDDEYAIATALGSFSLVVPDFARRPFDIQSCATYRLTASAWWQSGSRPRWTEVKPTRAAAMFSISEA